ncbi:hypothetical protein AVEN_218945-1 [Araneus ventricosus]|uniref:Uncharacterized protein n=1 Tax=Araneus ventricosus TaxID=182803 RepID=A0A4Y2W0S3_ARAVE|nr:hypothetical protein AVEN_204404-1 [Araneus ventricosus]GBO30161.1 hypothetical protein AVEN_218945-1 [Araneus ventricosus]
MIGCKSPLFAYARLYLFLALQCINSSLKGAGKIAKIKEVAPNTTEPAVSRFWKHDVKVARDYNKTLGENEGEDLGKQFLEEWANLNGIDPSTLKTDTEESRLTQLQTLMDIVEDAQEDDVLRTLSMSVPSAAEVSKME